MRLSFPLLFAIMATTALAAGVPATGTVSGRVAASASRQPVEYAAIVLNNAAGQPVQRTATNAKGEFAIENVPPGDYRVAYSLVGGDPRSSPAFHLDEAHRDFSVGTLEIGGDVVVMDKVEVTSRRDAFYNSIDRKTYNVGRDLKSVSGSASDLLQNIPSVQVDVDGNVSLRGNSSVLILVDGKPSTLMSATNRADVLAQMSADGIERIEVITNPSAKYKPDGTAGIINLVMKKQRQAGTSGTFRVSAGNDDRANAALSLGYNPGKYTVFGTASVRQDDRRRFGVEHRSHLDAATNRFIATEQDSSEHTRPLSRMGQLGFDYQPTDADKLGASVSYSLRTIDSNGVVSNRTLGADGAPTGDYDRVHAGEERQKTVEVKASYSHAFADEGHELAIEARHDREQEQENSLYSNIHRLPATPDSRDGTLNKPTETGTELTADYTRPLAGDGKLEAGYSAERNKKDLDFRGSLWDAGTGRWTDDTERTNRFVYKDTIQALYLTYGQPVGRFGFLAGARLEDTVVDTNQATAKLTDRTRYWQLHPSLHLSYSVSEAGQLQLNYSHRINRPDGDDLNPFPEYQDPFNLRAGNPRLRPEQTHSVEAGYQYHKGDTSYLAAVFFRDTYRAFTTVTRYIDPVTLLTTHENLAGNRSGGVEFAATTDLWTKTSLNFSANAYRSEIDAQNLGFSGKRSAVAWDAKLHLIWRATKADTIQVDANYSARRLTAQGYRLPNAFANLGWRHDIKSRNCAFTLTVSDVFNSMKERTVIDTPILHSESARRRSSRIVYAGFIYNFGKAAKKGKNDDLQFDTSM